MLSRLESIRIEYNMFTDIHLNILRNKDTKFLSTNIIFRAMVQVTVLFFYLTFRHRASCILGQALHYSPENAFYIFNQQIYFIIWYLLDRASLI